MKVLFSLSYYLPYTSGLTVYAKNLASRLIRAGIEVQVVCMRHDNNLSEREKIGKVNVLRINPNFALGKGMWAWNWGKRIAEILPNCDAVMVFLPQFEGSITAWEAKSMDVPLVSNYICDLTLPSGAMNKAVETLVDWSSRYTLTNSQKIVTYGKDYATHSRILKKFMTIEGKMRYIYPPVNKPQVTTAATDHIRKLIGKRKGEKIIGTLGRIAAEKGIEFLLNALPLLENKLGRVKIVIAGPKRTAGEEIYQHKIFKALSLLGQKGLWIGEIEEKEKGAYLKELDVLVLPSVNATEGFGIVQIEAMMVGTAVVASNLPGVREPVLKTGMGRLAIPKSSQSLAENIIEVVQDRTRYKKNQTRALQLFDPRRSAASYQKLFTSELLAKMKTWG